jgi:hypothetical protein
MSTSPVLPDEVQAIISAAQSLGAKVVAAQQQYAQLQQSDADIAQKFNLDEQTIAQMRAAIQPPIFTPTVYSKLHLRTDWRRGADVAGLAGDWSGWHPSPDGTVTITVNPTSAYNNWYLWTNLETGTRNPRANKFEQTQEWEVMDDAVLYCQEPETNFEQTLDNLQYNGGISPLLGSDTMRDPVTGLKTSTVKGNIWRWYDITPGRAGWYELPEIPFDKTMFGTGKHIRIVSEFERWDNKMTHVAATINGKRYEIERTSTAKPEPSWGPHIQNGFQLDSKQNPHPFSVKVWDMQVKVL